jgi:hypothetical protein
MVRDQLTENLGDSQNLVPKYTYRQLENLVFELAKKVNEMYPWYQQRKRQQLQGPLDKATQDLIRRL